MASAGKHFDESDLEKAIEAISHKGDFASLQTIPRCDPDIFVQDVGRIDLPLSEAQARQLIAKSHLASSGEDSDTIIHTSGGNTWELDPNQFEIRRAGWQNELNSMLRFVQNQLGITAPITAELDKMLIYEEGAMSKAHTDTKKIPGVFGTLDISLPSPHEGGDVVAIHCGMEKTLRTSKENMACLFWYSDVSHKVLPLTAGYRWVLTYNLVVDPATKIPTADGLLENTRLHQALQSWSQWVEHGTLVPSPRYWIFNHKYTDYYTKTKFSYQELKDADRDRARCLRKMSIELGFNIFLASVEKEQSGRADVDDGHDDNHDLIDVVEESYCAKDMFDLSGKLPLGSYISFDADQLINEYGTYSDDPDSLDYDRYRGWSTRAFLLSALIIVPCKGTDPFLSICGFDVQKLCDFFLTKYRNSPENKQPLLQLHELLLANYSSDINGQIAGDCLFKVLQLFVHRNDPKMLQLILSKNEQLPPIEFFVWIKEKYDNSAISIRYFTKLFHNTLSRTSTIRQAFEAITATSGGAEMTDEIQDTIYRAVDACIGTFRKGELLLEEEGPALFDLGLYHRGFDYLKEVVIPVVEQHSGCTPFALSFLKALQQSMKRGQVPLSEAQVLYKRVARQALFSIKLTIPTAIDSSNGNNMKAQRHLTYSSMLRFISSLITFNLGEHLELFSQKIHWQVWDFKSDEFNLIWIPLLQDLFPIFKQYKISLSRRPWPGIYQTVLKAYIAKYVQLFPPKPSLDRRCNVCPCAVCTSLGTFLADPGKSLGMFTLTGTQKSHLELILRRGNVDCEVTAERYGGLFSMVVKKTTKQHEADVDAWWTRRLDAEYQLEAFDQDMLRTLLADQFDDIVGMKLLERKDEPSALTRLNAEVANSSSNSPMPLPPNPAATPTGPWSTGPNHTAIPHRTPAVSQAWASQPHHPSTQHHHTPVRAPPPLPTYSTPQERPAKRPMLEVSRRISESANRLRATRDSQSRAASASKSSPSGGTPSRPITATTPATTTTIRNPVASAKRKHIDVEVIDLTGDD